MIIIHKDFFPELHSPKLGVSVRQKHLLHDSTIIFAWFYEMCL